MVRVLFLCSSLARRLQSPIHLDGTLAGDMGFDPLNLGEDPQNLAWYQQAELIHARFAMLAAAGAVAPSLFGSVVSWPGAGVEWYDMGTYDGYWCDTNTLLTVQFLFMGWAETRRFMDLKNPGAANADPLFDYSVSATDAIGYPGSAFNPMGYGKSGDELAALKLKEIKNGRLAMLTCVALYAQYAATGVGPVQNLADHLADPWNNNIITTFSDAFIWDYGNLTQEWVGPVIGSGVGYPAL